MFKGTFFRQHMVELDLNLSWGKLIKHVSQQTRLGFPS